MNTSHLQPPSRPTMPRPRRKSSSLGAELRGDNSAAALSTLEPTPTFASPPLTPVNKTLRTRCNIDPLDPVPFSLLATLLTFNLFLSAPIPQQVPQTALQTAKSPLLPPSLERLLLSAYLGEPIYCDMRHPRPLRPQPSPFKPTPPCHLPLIPALPR